MARRANAWLLTLSLVAVLPPIIERRPNWGVAGTPHAAEQTPAVASLSNGAAGGRSRRARARRLRAGPARHRRHRPDPGAHRAAGRRCARRGARLRRQRPRPSRLERRRRAATVSDVAGARGGPRAVAHRHAGHPAADDGPRRRARDDASLRRDCARIARSPQRRPGGPAARRDAGRRATGRCAGASSGRSARSAPRRWCSRSRHD